MGQYYKPVLLKNNKIVAWAYSHDFQHRIKLADGRSFMSGTGLKLMEHSYVGNTFVGAIMRKLYQNPMQVVWAGDYADPEKKRKNNLFHLTGNKEDLKIKASHGFHKSLRFILNHTKKEFVDLSKSPKDKDTWQIHPLPLLTAEGNQRGGGDFYGFGEDLVGYWSRNVLESVKHKNDIPTGYKEIVPDFAENQR